MPDIPKVWKRGAPITASELQKMQDGGTRQSLVAGENVRLERHGDRTLVHFDAPFGGRSGGFNWYRADVVGNLPSATAPALAYTDDGKYYTRSGAGAWEQIKLVGA